VRARNARPAGETRSGVRAARRQVRPSDETARVEQRLLESERRLRALTEGTQDAITRFDREGRCVYLNPSAARLSGLPEAAIVGKTIEELGRNARTENWEARLREVFDSGRPLRFDRRSVEGRWYDVQLVPELQGARVETVLSIARDVTDRRKAEEALRDGEERLRFALEVSHTGAWELDLVNHTAARSLEHDRIFGYSELLPEWTYEKFLEHVLPEDREAVDHKFRCAMGTGGEWNFECRIRRVDGEVRWIWAAGRHRAGADGAPRRLAGIVQDITEGKQADVALRESEARHKLLSETMLQGVVHQDAEGTIVSMNSAAERILGKTRPEFLGSSSVAEEHDTLREDGSPFPGLEHPAMLALRTGQPVRDVVMGVFNPREAGYRWISVDAVPLLRPGETKPYEVYTVFADITERRQAEEALRAANLELAQADRRKNAFLAVLSHELRNPLTPIRNSLFILEHALPGSEQARHAREVMTRQTGQLARLVDDLLDVTRISRDKIQLQRRPLDLNDLARRALEDHRSLLEGKGIRIETSFASERLPISGDEARLTQVVGNLLQNAAKFTPSGGSVGVGTRMIAERQRAVLRVVDSGVGMEAEMVRRLFEPFVQADTTLDRNVGGLGLGLALVKGFVEMHGGEVCAHSDGPGQGATFLVELPLQARAVAEGGSAPGLVAHARRRVLIVEDNVDAADSLRVALQLAGHVVEVAYDGHEGLAAARAFQPEFVLCDIGLPGMDGFEVAQGFRADESLHGIVLVALSGYALPEDQQRAMAAGFALHLAKPPSMEKLSQLFAEPVAQPPAPTTR
jgi:PAS domain S-box-containing protein